MGKQWLYIRLTSLKKTIYSITMLSSNWNNGSNAGSFYWNVNNTPSNRNRNYSSHQYMHKTKCEAACPAPWQNIKINQTVLVGCIASA
jgi:hypothetical protein